ncbi:unnamed protein product [Caenorhabditis sp. 36 PRJEB53466]|nr:unnamed protein product [Caenorhabditis sp. 36 PRJEB53466]
MPFVAAAADGSLTTNNYFVTLHPSFFDSSYTAEARIGVDVKGSVKLVNLKIAKDLKVKSVTFYTGLAQAGTFKYDAKKQVLAVTFKEPLKVGKDGYIEIEYSGKFGPTGANKGFYHVEKATYKTNLKNGNVISLFPILEDVAVPVDIVLDFAYETEVTTNLKTNKKNVKHSEQIISDFSSGTKKIKLSDVEFTMEVPGILILD